MKNKKEVVTSKQKPGETAAGLKNESTKKDAVKKGYNENNPSQPGGAFKPDALNKKR